MWEFCTLLATFPSILNYYKTKRRKACSQSDLALTPGERDRMQTPDLRCQDEVKSLVGNDRMHELGT